MKKSESLLKSTPPTVPQYIIYFGALTLLFLSIVMFMNVNALVGYWFNDIEGEWSGSVALSK